MPDWNSTTAAAHKPLMIKDIDEVKTIALNLWARLYQERCRSWYLVMNYILLSAKLRSKAG